MPKNRQPPLQRSSTMPNSRRPGPSHEIENDTTTSEEWSSPLPLPPPPKPQTQTNRIWSSNDEAIVLTEMLKYRAKGKDPETDINSFTEIVRRELPFVSSSTELMGEILRIKKKFKRSYREDKDKTFQSQVKQNVFRMSKMLWGEESDAEAGKGKGKVEETSTVGGGRGKRKAEYVELVGGEKKTTLKQILNKLKQLEAKGKKVFSKVRLLRKGMEEYND